MFDGSRGIIGVMATLASLNVLAESDLKLSTSISLQHRDVEVSDATAPYRDRGTTAAVSFSRPVFDSDTYAALSLSYGIDRAWSLNASTHSEINAGSATVSLMHYIGGGRMVSATLSYGRSALDNITSGVSYGADGDNIAVGVGIMQFIPLTDTLSGTAGLTYGSSRSNREGYSTSTGTHVSGEAFNQSAISFSGGLSWKLGAWTPTMGVGWSRGSKAVSLASSDRNSMSYSAGIGYAVTKDVTVGLSYGGTAGLSDVKDRNLGLTVSFPL